MEKVEKIIGFNSSTDYKTFFDEEEAKRYNPKWIVLIGDTYDYNHNHRFSKMETYDSNFSPKPIANAWFRCESYKFEEYFTNRLSSTALKVPMVDGLGEEICKHFPKGIKGVCELLDLIEKTSKFRHWTEYDTYVEKENYKDSSKRNREWLNEKNKKIQDVVDLIEKVEGGKLSKDAFFDSVSKILRGY